MKKIISLSLVCSMIFLWSFSSLAETLNQVKDMKSDVDKKINDINEKKNQQKESLKSAEEDKNKLLDAQSKYGTIKEKLQGDKNQQEKEKKTIEDTLAQAETDFNNSLLAFKNRARSTYVNSNKSYIDVLLNSQNLIELTSKMYILNDIAKKDREIVQNLKTTKKDLDYKKEIRAMEIAKVKMKIDQTNSALNTIKSNQSAVSNKIQDINDKLKKMEIEEDTLLQESQNLTNKIKLFAKTGRKYIGGKMLWPTPSCWEITSPYGRRVHPVLGYARMHTGIDVGAGYGASIVAANDGIVKMAEWFGGYGNAVIIEHGGGITSLYGHCSSMSVSDGQNVKAGQTIAKVGSTGMSTGPHLHFEVRVNGEPADPLNYLGK